MNKDSMNESINVNLANLKSYAKQLNTTIELLEKTSNGNVDVNFSTLEQTKILLSNFADINVKTTIGKIRKALLSRARQRLTDLSR